MKDRTMEFIKEFDEDDDFMVYPMAPEICTEEDVKDVEAALGIKFPDEYKAHILGEVAGGIQVEAEENVGFRKRGGGAAWMFFSGIHTFSPSKESEEWERLEIVGKEFMEKTGLKAVPVLKVLCDADVYCVDENGKLVKFSHEEYTLTEINMNFWELLDMELKALKDRKEKIKSMQNR